MDNSLILPENIFFVRHLKKQKKKNHVFWREILFHQSNQSKKYLTYSYLTIFHKVMTHNKYKQKLLYIII